MRGLRSTQESGLGQEFVFVDHSRDRHFSVCASTFHAQHASTTAHADTFRKSNFRRQGKREVNIRAGLNRRVDIKTDSLGTHVARLSFVLMPVLAVTDTYRQPQGKPPCD